MTDAELAAIRERAAKATPGPWKLHDSMRTRGLIDGTGQELLGGYDGSFPCNEDLAFMAASRMDIPALLEEVERLRKENTELIRLMTHTCRPSHLDY